MSVDSEQNPTARNTRDAWRSLLKLSVDQERCVGDGANLEHFLYERYNDDQRVWLRNLYYTLKPAIPRWLQLLLRRGYVGRQEMAQFPAWPIESSIVQLMQVAIRDAEAGGRSTALHAISPWPDGHAFAFCITHDVEWDAGLRRAPALLEVERRHAIKSSWNLVPERYPIDWRIVETLRSADDEIGIHGLKHDGQLFRSQKIFRERMARIEDYACRWGAVGFRSPSCLRNADWMREMKFEYDSSFPDTDPYEPQPGGCCSVWPYFLGRMVELPLTMPQDHTLYEILGHHDLALWQEKAAWIARVGGLVLINVHPDYIDTDRRLEQYEDFLAHMKRQDEMWHALPRDVARWWRQRDAMVLRDVDGQPRIIGEASERARVTRLSGESNGFGRLRSIEPGR